MNETNLTGKAAIVTGGSSGYGMGIAQALREAGAIVWITGRREARLREVADRTGTRPFVADVADGAAWDRLIGEVTAATGGLDLLVNNAGAGVKISPLIEQDDAAITQSLATNLTGAILGSRRAASIMARRGSGLIVNIGSVCAKHAWAQWGIYSAAKAGLLHFTRCLAAEMRPHGVRATSLLPSWGQTEFTDSSGLGPRNAEVLEKCISPLELGAIVVAIARQPAHLLVEEMTVWPMVQPISQL